MEKMKLYETSARYFLGVWHLICAVDGWAHVFFGIHFFNLPANSFYVLLMNTTWFWVSFKIIQTIGTISLLFNYKAPLGLALLTPVSAVLCIYYLVKMTPTWVFGPIAVLIMISTMVLFRAYKKNYAPLLADHS